MMRIFTEDEKRDSKYFSKKCTKTEARVFKSEVDAWLFSIGIKPFKTRGLTSFLGNVRIYTGKYIESTPRRKSLKHVTGNLYERSYHTHAEPEYTTLYRVEFEEDKKDADLLNHLKELFRKEGE